MLIAEAVAALRAVKSVADGGSVLDFKQYFLQAKVKVEALPTSPEASLLQPVLAAYADANTLFITGIRSGVGSFEHADWDAIVSRNPGIFLGTVTARSGATVVMNLREGAQNLVNEAYRRLQLAETQLSAPSPASRPAP